MRERWFGATGRLPAPFAILLPAAVAAGAALAIANARADLERDDDAGLVSVAARLGSHRAWVAQAALLLGVDGVALGSLWLSGDDAPAMIGALGASMLLVSGIAWARNRDASAVRRERAWEIEAIGVALLAAAWLAGMGDFR